MRTLHLSILGLGTVGSGVLHLLEEERSHLQSQCDVDLQVKHVVVRDPAKPRPQEVSHRDVSTDLHRAIHDPDVEIVVEVMGGIEPARTAILQALRAGKHVVTANKAVVAQHGPELFRAAFDSERALAFEASVAGGIPIIGALAQSLTPNRIRSLSGILNGTSNYILSAMLETGASYADALARAQELGFAEADPTLDVDGTDAAQKLAILARIAFQSAIDASSVQRRGIDTLQDLDIRFASELGYAIKLIAHAQTSEKGLHLRVAPTLVSKTQPLAQVRGEYNAINVVGHAVGDLFLAGKGAGMMPTASSVVSNIVDLAVGRGQETFRALKLWETSPPGPPFSVDGFLSSRFYLRYTISDHPGTLAQIAGILGQHGVSISSVIQHETGEDSIGAAVPLIVMTHQADEAAVRQALEETDACAIVREPTVCLHVAN